MELVTSLDLNNFLMAFTRFTNLRGSMDTVYSDNGSTFWAAADQLPKMLGSNEFQNCLRKQNINWVRISSNTRRMPSLIELQMFLLGAVRIVNNRPLTTLSDQPNDLLPICPSSFLCQELAPNMLVGGFHEKGDLRKDFLYNANMAHRFWLGWMQEYLPLLQKRNKWRTVQHKLHLVN